MQRLSCLLLLAALYGCAEEAQSPMAKDSKSAGHSPLEPVYELEIIDATLGGTVGVGAAINNAGVVAGYSTLLNGTRQAAVWRDGVIDSLRTLGGPNSAVLWPGINNTGMVAGISFTADADPHNANWSCETFMGASDRTCLGFYWEGGEMHPLETLGGFNGFATAVNNLGQIVGWSETAAPDSSCKAPQVQTFNATLWEPKTGSKQPLPPLFGDAASAATAINDRGQVVGISGSCYVAVGDSSARAAV